MESLPKLSELRLVVKTRYPNARVQIREHPTDRRYRVESGCPERNKWLSKSWQPSEKLAWFRAYKYTLPEIIIRLDKGKPPHG